MSPPFCIYRLNVAASEHIRTAQPLVTMTRIFTLFYGYTRIKSLAHARERANMLSPLHALLYIEKIRKAGII